MYRNRLKRWELALLLALAVTLLWGAGSVRRQEELERKLIRLHVIAHSDVPADQTLKLQVRDRVLALAGGILRSSADAEQAAACLARALPDLEAAAGEEIARQGFDYDVTVSLERTEFPLRTYEGFALPAGEYTALRVVIGEGKGRNWWCVVFPPLCTAAASELPETAAAGGLDREDVGLITGENDGYVLRFRALELWESIRQWLGKQAAE